MGFGSGGPAFRRLVFFCKLNALIALLAVTLPTEGWADDQANRNVVFTQQLLTAMGCYHGLIDGVQGASTNAAIDECYRRIGGSKPPSAYDQVRLLDVGLMMKDRGRSMPEALALLPQADDMHRLDLEGQTAQGNLDNKGAKDDFNRALAVADRLFGQDSLETLRIMAELGDATFQSGDPRAGDALMTQASQTQLRLFGPLDGETLGTSNMQAWAWLNAGRQEEAIARFRATYEGLLVEQGKDSFWTLNAMNNYGIALNGSSQFTDAIALFDDLSTLTASKPALGPLHLDALLNLSTLHESLGEFPIAEVAARQAVDLAVRIKAPVAKLATARWCLVASLADQSAEPAKVKEARATLDAILKAHLADSNKSSKLSTDQLEIMVLEAEGRAADAELLAQQVYDHMTTDIPTWSEPSMLALADLARAQYLAGHEDAAMTSYRQLIGRVPDYQIHQPRAATELTWRERRALADDLGLLAEKITPASAAESLQLQEWWTFGSVQVAMADLITRLSSSAPGQAEQVRQYQDLREQKGLAEAAYNAALASPTATDAQRRALATRLADLGIQISQAAEALSASGTSLADLVAVPVVSPSTLQAALHTGEALAAFAVTDTRLYTWLVRQDRIEWKVHDIPAQSLLSKVRRLRSAVDLSASLTLPPAENCALQSDSPALKNRPFDICASAELYDLTFGGFDLDGVDSLLVVPDGPLSAIPFSLLVVGRTADGAPLWLIDRVAISTLPSTSALPALRARSVAAESEETYLGVAPGTFAGLVPDHPLKIAPPSLPGTLDEIQGVASLFGPENQTLVEQASATEAYLKSADLSRYGTISLATHALMAEESAFWTGGQVDEPALLLYGAGDAADDGLFTATEAAGLKLNADWVILSGCNTAASGAGSGRDLSGLARAFFFAGAKALLVSQWSVQDAAAQALIVGTIANSDSAGAQGKAQALRAAILAMKAQPATSHPFFWAPFELVGDGASPARRHSYGNVDQVAAPTDAERGMIQPAELRGTVARPGTLTTPEAMTANEASETALSLKTSDRTEIQLRLTALSGRKLPSSGKMDAATRTAIRDWQSAIGIAATGFLNGAQLAKLKADSQSAYEASKALIPPSKPTGHKTKKCTKFLFLKFCN